MNCAECGREIATSLDEYGDRDAPVCFACFTEPEKLSDEDEREINDLEKEIEEAENHIEGLKAHINDLESEIDDSRDEIRAKRDRIKEIESPAPWEVSEELKRLKAWTTGQPIKA